MLSSVKTLYYKRAQVYWERRGIKFHDPDVLGQVVKGDNN